MFKGRIDDQVKINGYRVELLEIESVLRSEAETTLVAAIPWPINESGLAEGIVAFTCGAAKKSSDLIKACKMKLPSYMVPRKVIEIEAMPRNTSGKIDRSELKRLCSQI